MSEVHPLLKAFMEPGETDFNNAKFPKAFVEKMLETNTRVALEKGHRDEREELVCRLLASGMYIDEISVVLKIRAEEISQIEHANPNIIADYAKKLKARRKSREERKIHG